MQKWYDTPVSPERAALVKQRESDEEFYYSNYFSNHYNFLAPRDPVDGIPTVYGTNFKRAMFHLEYETFTPGAAENDREYCSFIDLETTAWDGTATTQYVDGLIEILENRNDLEIFHADDPWLVNFLMEPIDWNPDYVF